MATITIPRSDVTSAEVAEVLREGLGHRYHVLPGRAINAKPSARPGSDPPDMILVGTGSNRMFRAEVAISRCSGLTSIRVTPGGLPGTWPGGVQLVNALGIARRVRQVLRAAPGLR